MVGLAVPARAGDMEEAIRHFRTASELAPHHHEAAYRESQALLALDRTDLAIERLRAIVAIAPGASDAANDLGYLLAERGEELDFALALAMRSVQLDPAPHHFDTLAFVQMRRGEDTTGMATVEESLAKYPMDSQLHYRRGQLLARGGNRVGAAAALRTSLAGEPFPSRNEAEALLARLEASGSSE